MNSRRGLIIALAAAAIAAAVLLLRHQPVRATAPTEAEAERILEAVARYELKAPGIDQKLVEKWVKGAGTDQAELVALRTRPCSLFGHSDENCDGSLDSDNVRWKVEQEKPDGWPHWQSWWLKHRLKWSSAALGRAQASVSGPFSSTHRFVQEYCRPSAVIPNAGYVCSAPVLVGDFAFVRLNEDCGSLCGSGELIALRRSGVDWFVVGRSVLWMK
jgi:hypothetical protein